MFTIAIETKVSPSNGPEKYTILPSPSGIEATFVYPFCWLPNATLFGGTGYYYDTPSSNSTAFGVNYTYALPGDGINLNILNESGGIGSHKE